MEKTELSARLKGSLGYFTQFFFDLRTGQEFRIAEPPGRESHTKIIWRALTRVMRGECSRLIIKMPPRYGKTISVIHFIAWALANYPDSNFIYSCYSGDLATKHTAMVRDILSMEAYEFLFDVKLSPDSKAKNDFSTLQGGNVYAAGAGGTITGVGAGLRNSTRFGGALIMDDMLKPAEALSDTVRENLLAWYLNTMRSRVNDPTNTPIIYIGHALHEDDLVNNLQAGFAGDNFEVVSLPALDNHLNPLDPSMHTREDLLIMRDKMPYDFYAQYQQDPQPAGGAIFDPSWLIETEYEPEIISTFITADTAETDKTYNDATVFSLFGLYALPYDSSVMALHWLDCVEFWCEPRQLRDRFMEFFALACRHTVRPYAAAIEKKSTGVTLLSMLKDVQSLQVIEIDRNAASGSKIRRFIDIQDILSQKLVTLPKNGRHNALVREHLRKITPNGQHKRDDIADTLEMGVKLGLIDKVILKRNVKQERSKSLDIINQVQSKRINSRISGWQGGAWQK